MITFKVEHKMELNDWHDHIFGSGAFSWGPWWYDYKFNDDTEIIEIWWYTDIDRNQNTEKWTGTYQDIANAASYLAENGWGDISKAIIDDDFDAIAMDCTLQQAVIGKVKYG